MQFKDVVGHHDLKVKLCRAARGGRLSHAQLVLGGVGSGNLALTLAYVQYILCPQRTDEDSCGTCPSCVKITKLAHPDLHFSFPVLNDGEDTKSKVHMETFRKAVTKDPYMTLEDWTRTVTDEGKNLGIFSGQCNEIIKDLSLKSFESPFKFLIMWLPETLHNDVGNKLLKIIEEPPTKTLFFLVTHNEEPILQTIRSRVQLIKLKKITDFDLLDALTLRYNLPLEKAREIVNIADGNFHTAIRLAEMDDYKDEHFTFVTKWFRNAFAEDLAQIMKIADEFASFTRTQQRAFLEYSLFLIRESLVFHVEPELMRITEQERTFISKFAQVITESKARQMADLLEKSIKEVGRNAHPKLLLTHVSLDMHAILNPRSA